MLRFANCRYVDEGRHIILKEASGNGKIRESLNFCKEFGIRLSGKRLSRPKKLETDKKTEYQDNTDRIEVERKFSLAKRKFGLDFVRLLRRHYLVYA